LGGIVKLHVIGILCLSVTACAPGIAVPVPTPSAPPKFASEVVNAAAVTPRDGAGAIFVTRDKQLRDTRCTYDISLDGQLVAGLRSGEQVTIYADPGRRIVGVSIRGEASCDPALAQVPVQVVASATTKIRVWADHSYDLRIEATTY
jgi:hypothetical protein